MKVEMLMDAIENIDDSYIEEFACDRRRFSKAPWGMIASAACLCLVIVAAIFLHNAGWMPYFGGPSQATNPPIVTDPSDLTIPSQTTRPVAEPEELDSIRALFSNKSGWYYRALVDTFASPKELHLRYYFYNSREFGEGLQPTKEEWDELMTWEDYQSGKRLVILPVSKMDAILKETFGITVEEMDDTAFAGMKYAESIDSWCFAGIGMMNVTNISIQDVVKEVGDIFRMVYTAGEETYEVTLKPNGEGYHIVSNMNISSELDNTRPSVEELFSQKGSWHNILLSRYFSDPTELWGNMVYGRTYDGKKVILTEVEKDALREAGLSGNVWRMTEGQLNEISFSCLNIPWNVIHWIPSGSGFGPKYPVYLEETGCWYGPASNDLGGDVEVIQIEEGVDGTINFLYNYIQTLYNGTVEKRQNLAILQPHETGYYILSNQGKVVESIESKEHAMETLFGDYNSWYNRALVCEYTSPEELRLVKFFYRGFADEPQQPTDQEWAQLKDQPGFEENFDLFRLPVDKMNTVLTQYFGITLEDVKPEGFENLVYLESTNCYYFMATGALIAENFTALGVGEMDDGTICVEYQCAYPANTVFEVMMKPSGDGYQILSNVVKDPS